MKKSKKPRLTDEERAIRKLWRKAYRAHWNALQRTTDPSHKNYKHYGGRGITMDAEWAESPDAFIADMGLPPSHAHSLDRRDNDGPYSRDNCRWILRGEQTRNTRKNIWVDVGYGIMIASDADRRLGLREGTVAARIQKAIKKAVKPFSDREAA
jgi:hypothetical protein